MMNTPRETYHVFDLVFKRIIQEISPRAIVCLVNGLFDTDLPLDSEVSFPNREKVSQELKRIVSDMMILVAGEVFHIEAQIDEDLNMALRMFRYGYHEAIGRPRKNEDGSITIRFPQARILLWETTRKMADIVTLHVIFPDRTRHDFQIPVFKVLDHDIGELKKLRLAVLLPFYMLKYRKQVRTAQSAQMRFALVAELEQTMKALLETVEQLREAGLLTGEDEVYILGEIKVMYSELYEPYEEFKGARTMIEDRLMNPYTKWKMELAEARKEAEELKRAAEESKRAAEESKRAAEESKRTAEESKRAAEQSKIERVFAAKMAGAKNLIKEGVSPEVVARALGITLEDIKRQPADQDAVRT